MEEETLVQQDDGAFTSPGGAPTPAGIMKSLLLSKTSCPENSGELRRRRINDFGRFPGKIRAKTMEIPQNQGLSQKNNPPGYVLAQRVAGMLAKEG